MYIVEIDWGYENRHARRARRSRHRHALAMRAVKARIAPDDRAGMPGPWGWQKRFAESALDDSHFGVR